MRLLDKRHSLFQKIDEINPIFQKSDYGWVLMFHEITLFDEQADNNISIKKIHFEDLINILQQKYKICDIKDIIQKRGANQIYITFDDIFSSAYNNAFSLLEEKCIPFCCFVSPGLIGNEGYIDLEQLKELTTMKYCTICFHGAKHIVLRNKSESEMLEEMIVSSDYNDFIFDGPNESEMFAYPFGSKYAVPHEAITICEEIGYKYAFGTVALPLNEKYINTHCFFLPRININDSNWGKVIKRIQRFS